MKHKNKNQQNKTHQFLKRMLQILIDSLAECDLGYQTARNVQRRLKPE